MHFKYSGRFSEEIDEGPRRSALKAHYSPETNSGCGTFLYLYLHFLHPDNGFVVGRRAAAPSDVKDNQRRKAAKGRGEGGT